MANETQENRTTIVARIWWIGVGCYVLLAVPFALVPIWIPWIGLLMVLICGLVHLSITETDARFLIGSIVAVGALVTAVQYFALGDDARRLPEAITLPAFIFVVVLPLAIAFMAVRRSRTRWSKAS